jgi:hypothetical protein
MTREYRHLQMCKRAGRGHDSVGVPKEEGSSELFMESRRRSVASCRFHVEPVPSLGLTCPMGGRTHRLTKRKSPVHLIWRGRLMEKQMDLSAHGV